MRATPLTSWAMSSHRRVVAATVLVATCVALSACGDNSTAASNAPAQVRTTSYVMVEPETTTTTLAASAVTTLPPEGATDPNEQIYVIAAGDSVSRIASIHEITMDQLVEYNQWADGINHVLIPGAEVKIPPGAKVPGTGSSTATATGSIPAVTEPPPPPCTYTIEANDTPTRVAEKFGISVQILQQANASTGVMNSFVVGDTLVIPGDAEGC